MTTTRGFRYLLDAHGLLHPMRLRGHVDAVAIVTVRLKRRADPRLPPAPSERLPSPSRVRRAAAPGVIDGPRLAQALASRPSAKRVSTPAPKIPAPSREGCVYCGVPGFKGCAHWLPYEAPR